MAGNMIHNIYSKLARSGIRASDHVPAPDLHWQDNGYLEFFDQRPYIEKALDKYVEYGGARLIRHHLNDFGYYYYPKSCVHLGAFCKLAIVLHGANGLDHEFLDAFGRYASVNNLVLVWPSVNGAKGWDSTGATTGKRYDTKEAIHTLFIRELVGRV